MNVKYFVKSDDSRIGPFSKNDALSYLANAIRLFFMHTPSPGFHLRGTRDIYDKCTFGTVSIGLPPVFLLNNRMALLHGFSDTSEGIKVKYILALIPEPDNFIYDEPKGYIDTCNPTDVKSVNVPTVFFGDSWLYLKVHKFNYGIGDMVTLGPKKKQVIIMGYRHVPASARCPSGRAYYFKNSPSADWKNYIYEEDINSKAN
jgi:hypothetical protein